MNKKIITSLSFIIIALGILLSFFYLNRISTPVPVATETSSHATYKNTEYGFDFTLPESWLGYTVITDKWTGTALKNKTPQTGPKLLIRHPKWIAAQPYEDIPVLIFTLSQWDKYVEEDFTVSAAPIMATELGRNNMYVFALPPRWNFDYSLNYEEATSIVEGKPLRPFTIQGATKPSGKINITLVCEKATETMRFVDKKSMDAYIADCVAGKYPEVIEKYKAEMNLGDGAMI